MYGEEHGACGEHDSGVVDDPRVVKAHEVVDGLLQERMSFFCEHEVVGDSYGNCLWQNDGVDKKWIQRFQAPDIKINVDTAIVVENKVPDGVCTLDRVDIVVERIKEP